jgi:predicted ABC-type ATPase
VDEIVIIGGPNGAGKTTAAQLLVPHGLEIREFVNADEIARGLSPFNPEHAAFGAGRLMLQRISELIRNASRLRPPVPVAPTYPCYEDAKPMAGG